MHPGVARSRRIGLAGSVAVLAASMATGSAAASGPTREDLPLPEMLIDDSCGYSIEVTFPRNDEFGLTFFDRDGEPVMFIVAGLLVATFTNPSTDASVTANISGPTHVLRNGSAGSGRWALWPDGELTILAGRSDFDDGSFRGHTFASVCDLLAG